MDLLQKLSNFTHIQTDKILHFGVSFIGSFILNFIHPLMSIFVFLFGLYKEFTDMHEKDNFWSWGDILADIIGIVFALSIYYIII
jgi:hypothetical protein